MKKISLVLITLVILSIASCSTDPELKDVEETNIVDARSMIQMMNGAYHEMVEYHYRGRNFIVTGEIMSDNAYANGHSTRFHNTSQMNVLYTNDNDSEAGTIFKQIYNTIAPANIVINTDITPLLEDEELLPGEENNIYHALGEAYTLRALAHFDLLRLFGQTYVDQGSDLGITYKKEYKPEDGEDVPRGTVEENKASIYDDIEKAIETFQKGTGSERSTNKTNITLDAAYALKSRVGVYFGTTEDYQEAKDAAAELIGTYDLTDADDYVDYWRNTNPGSASIFELAQSSSDNAGPESLGQIFRGEQYGDIVPFDNFIEDADFSDNDVRASEEMIGHNVDNAPIRNVGKYPHRGSDLGIDNIKIFRYAEVVLNYSEALLKTDSAPEALTYLNKVPNHRNATPYSTANMDNILKERRKEFVFEGSRFFDLARTGSDVRNIDPSSVNNHGHVDWGSYNYALPIPRGEMDANKASEQNPGYGGGN